MADGSTRSWLDRYTKGGPNYRAPLRWRLTAIPLILLIAVVIALNITDHATWTWALPALSDVLAIPCVVILWRSRSPKQSAVGGIGQMIFTIGALALIAVPVSM